MFRLLTLVVLLQPPAAEEKPSLYIIEGVDRSRVQNVVRLSLDREGRFVKQEILSRDDVFYSNGGGEAVLDDRHVMTRFGIIIDVSTKKVVCKEVGEILGVEKGKAYYIRPGREVWTCDFFDGGKIVKLADGGHWALPRPGSGIVAKSPNRTMSAINEGDCIKVYRLDKEPLKLSKDYRVEVDERRTWWRSSDLPCLWLDDHRILTVKSNHKLAIVTVPAGDEQLIDLPDAPEKLLAPPYFWRDAKRNIFYICSFEKEYVIDVEKKTAAPPTRYALGHGFEASIARGGQYEYFYDGKSIGVNGQYPRDVPTAPGRIAIRSKSGVAIWDADLRDWREFRMNAASIVGWAKK